MHDHCPSRESLSALLAGSLSDAEERAIEGHIGGCAPCQTRLQSIADADAVLPKTAIPAMARNAADSARLKEVIEAMRRGPHAPATARGANTDVVPCDDVAGQPAGRSRRPSRIGDYRVEAVLGQGGIGIVYRASDQALHRDVAIKVLRPALADDAAMRERFLREARNAAALRHDHVVAVYGVGEHAEQPYLVMEYIAGGSLADRLARKGKLPCDEVVRLGIEVAGGLAAAHAKGIVHRDVKPGNILWDVERARYKLTDFGLAKALDDVRLTQTGAVAGTPEFLSPEQAEGSAVDARSDLFSLGAVLYAACSGQSPFRADSTLGALHRVRTHMPPDLRQTRDDCPKELAQVVQCLLAKDPNHRYASATEVVEDLSQLGGGPAGASGGIPAGANGRRRGARPGARGIAAAAMVLLAAAAFFWYGTREQTVADADAKAAGPELSAAKPAFIVRGSSASYDSLGEAVARAAAGDVIEVRGSGPMAIEPLRLVNKPLVVRAAEGHRPVFVPQGSVAAGPAIVTDADLTLARLEIRWAGGGSAPASAEEALGGSAILATGGTLRLDHCELTVGRRDACVVVTGAACTLENSRLSALDGMCMAWRPGGGDRLAVKNCVLAGQICLSLGFNGQPGELPTTLELSQNTWQGKKGLQLNVAGASRLSLSVKSDHNLFAVDHLLVLYWPFRGPRAVASPSLAFFRGRLREMMTWQERENHYGAATRFLSRQSPRQPVTPVDDGPSDVAAWEAFWNRPASGSRQGAEKLPELRGKVGAEESNVGFGS